jgi:hypothetical protein
LDTRIDNITSGLSGTNNIMPIILAEEMDAYNV